MIAQGQYARSSSDLHPNLTLNVSFFAYICAMQSAMNTAEWTSPHDTILWILQTHVETCISLFCLELSPHSSPKHPIWKWWLSRKLKRKEGRRKSCFMASSVHPRILASGCQQGCSKRTPLLGHYNHVDNVTRVHGYCIRFLQCTINNLQYPTFLCDL